MSGRKTWVRGLHIDITPLRASSDFRAVFASRTITLLGSQATEVALLIQAKQLTGSALDVGLLGAAELVPLVVFGLYGGTLADRLDRRRVARWSEAGLCGLAVALAVNASLPRPALWPLYVIAAATMALAALQRPSLDSSIPRLIARDQLTAASALLSLSANASSIAGSALGGLLAAGPGPASVYATDAVSFAVSFLLLCLLRPLPPTGQASSGESSRGQADGGHAPGEEAGGGQQAPGGRALLAGLRYAVGRQELVGSYLADLAAMTLAYPGALIPFVAASLHAPWAAGLMFSATSAGAFAASALSGWAGRVRRHGRAIALAAAAWGAAVACFGLVPNLALALACLAVAGAADMLSGVFRDTLWNQTIPDSMRGRLAGVEVLSYGLGPSAGQLRAGAVATVTSPAVSLWSGGVACVAAVGLVCLLLPGFSRYRAPLEGGAVSTGPVDLQPDHESRPGAGHLQDADHDQQAAADLHDPAGMPAREAERLDPSLEQRRHDNERNAEAQAVDEGEEGTATRGTRGGR
jgi:MFS family permease